MPEIDINSLYEVADDKTADVEALKGDVTVIKFQLQSILDALEAGLSQNQIGSNAISTRHIEARAITDEEIEEAAILATKIAEAAVTAGKIAAGAVTEGAIGTAAVSEIKLAANAVTENKIAANAVVADKIYAGAVGAEKIAANAVLADHIAANAVTTDKLNALAVTADKIAASAITTVKLNALSVTADKIAAGTITANKYAELRNTYVFNGDDSLDSTHPFELDFEIVSETTSIQSVKLSFRINKFRAYSTAASGGSGATISQQTTTTTPSGGGHTSSSASSGTSRYVISGFTAVTNVGDEQTDGMLPTGLSEYSLTLNTHTHSVYNHQHGISHTHTTPAHTHDITYGIYEETTSPTINVYVSNDGTNYGSSIGAYTTDQLDIALTGISGTGFKRVKFTSNVRTRITAWVMCKVDITA